MKACHNLTMLTTRTTAKTFRSALGVLSTSPQALKSAHEEIGQNQSEALEAFPADVRDTVNFALDTTRQRIETSQERGRLSPKEAAMGLEMMRELTEGLGYIARGDAVVVQQTPNDAKGWRMIVETPTNDQFEIRTRPLQNREGQARIGIRQVSDDGTALDKRERLDLRLDRAPRSGTAVDVHFLKKSLNVKVHGRTGIGGGANPNHHFDKDLPAGINHPEKFSQLVHDFQNGVMAQFEPSTP